MYYVVAFSSITCVLLHVVKPSIPIDDLGDMIAFHKRFRQKVNGQQSLASNLQNWDIADSARDYFRVAYCSWLENQN